MNEDMLPEPEFTAEQTDPQQTQTPAEEPEVAAAAPAEPRETAAPAAAKKENWQKQLFKDARDVLYMLAIFMLVYILCFRTVVVVGNSMYDTLVPGDRLLLINNLLYRQPQFRRKQLRRKQLRRRLLRRRLLRRKLHKRKLHRRM